MHYHKVQPHWTHSNFLKSIFVVCITNTMPLANIFCFIMCCYCLEFLISIWSFSSSVLCLLLYPVTCGMCSFSPRKLWTQSTLPHPGLCSLLHHHPQHQESVLCGLRKYYFCSWQELQQVGTLCGLLEGEPHHYVTMHCWWHKNMLLIFFLRMFL